MDEKRSICKCSNTPEARNFTKGQAHVHCPCDKCEDRAVYPMVAWRHMRKRARYSDENRDGADLDNVATSLQPETSNCSDCVSVSNYHAEFSCSPSLLMAAGGADEGEADESEVTNIDNLSLSDDNVESNSSSSSTSAGSESDLDENCNVVEEETNNMADFVRDAVLRLVEIKGTVGFSIDTFEDLLKWGRTLHCENNEEAKQHWPSSWEDVQSLLGDFGFKMPKLYYICLDSSHPCQYAIMESKTDVCPHCGKQGTIPYYYLSVKDKVKRWFSSEEMCKKMTAHWQEREHWLPPERQEGWGWHLKKEFWDGIQFAKLSYFWDPDKEWTLPVKCPVPGCKTVVSAELLMSCPHKGDCHGETREVECPGCFNVFDHVPQKARGDPRNLAYDGMYNYGTQLSTKTFSIFPIARQHVIQFMIYSNIVVVSHIWDCIG